MTALPADVAKYTQDGVVVTSEDLALKAAHRDAQDLGTAEIESFFVDPANTQTMLDETLDLLSNPAPLALAIEVDETIRIGTSIPYTPKVPTFRYIDDAKEIDALPRLRGFAYEMGTDRYSIELRE